MSLLKRHPEWRHHLLVAGATLSVASAAVATTAWASDAREHITSRATAAAGTRQAPASAAPGTRRVLGGFTSQGWPVVIVLSRDRSHIVRIGIGLTMRCTSGDRFDQGDGAGPLTIGARGKVKMAVTIPPAAGSTVSLVGGSDVFAGTLARGGAAFAGVWGLHGVSHGGRTH